MRRPNAGRDGLPVTQLHRPELFDEAERRQDLEAVAETISIAENAEASTGGKWVGEAASAEEVIRTERDEVPCDRGKVVDRQVRLGLVPVDQCGGHAVPIDDVPRSRVSMSDDLAVAHWQLVLAPDRRRRAKAACCAMQIGVQAADLSQRRLGACRDGP